MQQMKLDISDDKPQNPVHLTLKVHGLNQENLVNIMAANSLATKQVLSSHDIVQVEYGLVFLERES